MKNKILVLVVVVIVIIAGFYAYSQYSERNKISGPGSIPCSFVLKSKTGYSGPSEVGYAPVNRLVGDYYYATSGCGQNLAKNAGDYFVEIYKCENNPPSNYDNGFTYSLEELKNLVSKNELSSKCQRLK